MRTERSVLRLLFVTCFTAVLVACGAAEPTTRASDSPKATSPKTLQSSPPGTRLALEPDTSIPIEADDIVSGSATAPVTLVAFLDYECGFCAQGFGRLAELRGKYDASTLRIVLKQLPLDFHPEALPAAIAAQSVKLVAGDDVALDYSALLFGNQERLGAEAYAEFAAKLGVDAELFREAITAEETIARVGADVLLSRKLGVSGTPAFFVNGRALAGAYPLETFTALVDEERAATLALVRDGDVRRAYAERVRANSAQGLATSLLAEDPRTHRVELGDSPRLGAENAKVTLVVFTDFECPYCKKGEATLTELRRLYGPDLRVVWKHLPLPFHSRAKPAARVARLVQTTRGDAAFFRFAAELFESSPRLEEGLLRERALRAGVPAAALERALAGGDVDIERALEKDAELADDLLARGTPHFFVNGLRLSGARPLAHFQAVIDEARRRADALLRERPDANVYEETTRAGVVPGAPQKVTTIPPTKDRPRRGALDALVTIHVWSDFECPYCRKAEGVLAELEKEFPGELAFVWHDLPLDFHEKAGPAARLGRLVFRERGSEAFFRYHARVFALDADGAKVERSELLDHARSLGLSAKKAEDALSGEADATMLEDAALAESLGIRGTPAFVVGDYLVTGAQPKRHFERLVRLAKREKVTASPSPSRGP